MLFDRDKSKWIAVNIQVWQNMRRSYKTGKNAPADDKSGGKQTGFWIKMIVVLFMFDGEWNFTGNSKWFLVSLMDIVLQNKMVNCEFQWNTGDETHIEPKSSQCL